VPDGMTRIPRDYLWRLWLRGSFDKGAVDHWQQSLQPPPPPKPQDSSAAGQAEPQWTTVKGKKGSRQQQQQPGRPPLPQPVEAAAASLAHGVQPDLQSSELLELLAKHLWSLPWVLRQHMASYWWSQVRQQWAEELQELLQVRATKLQQELRGLQSSSYEALLSKARVIGCTTTGAALQKHLLTSRTIAPK